MFTPQSPICIEIDPLRRDITILSITLPSLLILICSNTTTFLHRRAKFRPLYDDNCAVDPWSWWCSSLVYLSLFIIYLSISFANLTIRVPFAGTTLVSKTSWSPSRFLCLCLQVKQVVGNLIPTNLNCRISTVYSQQPTNYTYSF